MKEFQVDSVLAQWFRQGPEQGPEHGLNRALAAVHKVDQRPGWMFPRWWLPSPVRGVEMRLPRTAVLGLLVALTIIALLAMAAVFGGRSLHNSELFGPAATRLVAFEDGNEVKVSRIDGSGLQTLSGTVPFARLPVFSPDGTRVAFIATSTSASLAGRLLVVSVTDPSRTIDVSHGVELVAAEVPQFSWSPDGTRLVFAAGGRGTTRIWIAAADGSRAAPITEPGVDRDLPSWAFDGQSIALRATEADGQRRHLRRINPDGTNEQEIAGVVARDAYFSGLRHSPDGRTMSYWRSVGFGAPAAAVIDLGAGHSVEPWSNGAGGLSDFGVPWSPDGTKLAVLTPLDGLLLADADLEEPYDRSVRHLGPVADCWVDWLPDGSGLYGGSPDGCQSIVVIPLSDPSRAVPVPGSASGIASWQPEPLAP